MLFNHESPFRNKDFVTQKIISGALECSHNNNHKVKLGNLDISRDWGWAEEYVEGMQIINRTKKKKDYIICTGRLTSLKDFIRITFQKLDLDWENYIISDPKVFRKKDIKQSHGDPQAMEKELNWKAKVHVEEIIEKLINFRLDNIKI